MGERGDVQRGQELTRLPLHDRHAAAGAQFSDEHGTPVPAHYGDVAAEYRAATETVALCDVSDAAQALVSGGDRVRFLQGMVTNDVAALAEGARCLACLCNDKGGIQAVLDCWRRADDFLLLSNPGTTEAVFARLDRYLVAEDVTLTPVTGQFGLLKLLGPQAAAALGDALGTVPDAGRIHSAALADHEVAVARRDRESLTEFVLLTAADGLAAVADRLAPAVAAHGGRWAGREAQELVRIAAGLPRWGREVGEDTFPQEVGLRAACSFTKGCYIGQEVVLRIEHRGHINRTLARVHIEGACPPLPAELRANDQVVGRLTSAARFPDGRVLGLALLRRAHAAPGTRLALPDGAVTVRGQ